MPSPARRSGQAVVVRATGEVGAAIVVRLCEAGVPVVAVARDRDRLEQLSATDDGIQARGVSVETVLAEYRSHSPLGRMTTVDQVSWAVTQLLAPEADALHGATLALDGGSRRGLF